MASAFFVEHDAPVRRTKKVAKPVRVRVSPDQVVQRLLETFPDDMARLAE